MSTTHVWALIQQWMDAQFFRVSQAQLAEKIGVSRSALSQWKTGQARPRPEHLRALHRATRIDYDLLVEAVVQDMGYRDPEVMGNATHPAPMNEAEPDSAGEGDTSERSPRSDPWVITRERAPDPEASRVQRDGPRS